MKHALTTPTERERERHALQQERIFVQSPSNRVGKYDIIKNAQLVGDVGGYFSIPVKHGNDHDYNDSSFGEGGGSPDPSRRFCQ